jgi:hypothetical protein
MLSLFNNNLNRMLVGWGKQFTPYLNSCLFIDKEGTRLNSCSKTILPNWSNEFTAWALTRVNSTNVLDEGLRIGEIGRRMNSKVKSVKQGVYQK